MNSCNNDSVVLISSRPRLQGTLGAALGAVVAGLVLTGGQAKALSVPVTVGGLDYDVTTFTGTYADNASKFTTTDMPWWEDLALAKLFTAAVGTSFGLPNSLSSMSGPIFAYYNYVGSLYQPILGRVWIQGNQQTSSAVWTTDSFTYAIATPAASTPGAPSSTASVPGPLPILGLAAAFGFSRQLRKRIKSSTNTLPSSSAS